MIFLFLRLETEFPVDKIISVYFIIKYLMRVAETAGSIMHDLSGGNISLDDLVYLTA